MKIQQQILALGAAGALLIAAVGLMCWQGQRRQHHDMQEVIQASPSIRMSMDADMMHDALRADVLAARMARQAQDEDGIKAAAQDFGEHAARFRKSLQELGPMLKESDAAPLLQAVTPEVERYIQSGQAAMDSTAEAPPIKPFMEAFEALEDRMEKLGDAIEKQTSAINEEATHTGRLVQWLVLLAVGSCWVLMFYGANRLRRSVLPPIAFTQMVAHRMADGDLTMRIQPRGSEEARDMLEMLEKMRTHWQSVLGDVSSGIQVVNSASAELVAGSRKLSDRTEQQASALEQTAATMQEMRETAMANAEHARQAAHLVEQASTVAEQGGERMRHVIATMGEIQDRSRKIGDIIGVIDSIAFQTNILALNAAVEAARAGEQGRGFAVVASEVRSLAGRAAEAAREIKQLIQASVERVEAGNQQVSETGETIAAVVSNVREVRSLIQSISQGLGDQGARLGEINSAVGQLDRNTQDNASLSEESSHQAQELHEQAIRLEVQLKGFRFQ